MSLILVFLDIDWDVSGSHQYPIRLIRILVKSLLISIIYNSVILVPLALFGLCSRLQFILPFHVLRKYFLDLSYTFGLPLTLLYSSHAWSCIETCSIIANSGVVTLLLLLLNRVGIESLGPVDVTLPLHLLSNQIHILYKWYVLILNHSTIQRIQSINLL